MVLVAGGSRSGLGEAEAWLSFLSAGAASLDRKLTNDLEVSVAAQATAAAIRIGSLGLGVLARARGVGEGVRAGGEDTNTDCLLAAPPEGREAAGLLLLLVLAEEEEEAAVDVEAGAGD
jgi:hypothetical protein